MEVAFDSVRRQVYKHVHASNSTRPSIESVVRKRTKLIESEPFAALAIRCSDYAVLSNRIFVLVTMKSRK